MKKIIKSEPILEEALKLGHPVNFYVKDIRGVQFQIPKGIARLNVNGKIQLDGWEVSYPSKNLNRIFGDEEYGFIDGFNEAVEYLNSYLLENPPNDHNVILKPKKMREDKSGLNIPGVWFYGSEYNKQRYGLTVCVSFPAKKSMHVRRDFRIGTVKLNGKGYEAYVYPTRMLYATKKAVALRRYAERCIKEYGYVEDLLSERNLTDVFIDKYLSKTDNKIINRLTIQRIVEAALDW